jgi:hypothetical protein
LADDAGSLLVRAGLIADEQLLLARQAQASHGGTIGEHLVLSGFVDDEDLTSFYRNRLLVPRVDPNDLARIPTRLIQLLPPDMAAEFRVVPVALDRDQNLTVAMSDPSHTHAVDEIGFFTGTYVVRAVATQHQIAWCLAHYYGYLTPLGETLLQPEATQNPPSPAVPAAGGGSPRPVTDPAAVTATDPSLRKRAEKLFSKPQQAIPKSQEDKEEDTGPTGRLAPRGGRRSREPTRPELKPRSGELTARGPSTAEIEAMPSVVLDDGALHADPSAASVTVEPGATADTGTESKPILLQPKSPAEEVVLLDSPKAPARGRRRGPTDVGLGKLSPSPTQGRAAPTVRPHKSAPPPPSAEVTPPPLSARDSFDPYQQNQEQPAAGSEVASELEASASRLVETLCELDTADSRNRVLDLLLDHLASICRRVAFFAVRDGALYPFAGRAVPSLDQGADGNAARLPLDQPSTFRDIVRARLPFHGPLRDESTRAFLRSALVIVPDDVLAVPVAVRGRVVGILYGDEQYRPLFSDHLVALSRSTGVALERILKAQKGS